MNKTANQTIQPRQVYEVRPRKDHRGVDLISDVLPFGRLWLRLNQTLGATQSDTRSMSFHA
jgi:hypothetical protein